MYKYNSGHFTCYRNFFKTVLYLLVCAFVFISVATASPKSSHRSLGNIRRPRIISKLEEDSEITHNNIKITLPIWKEDFSINEIKSAVSPTYCLDESFPVDKIQVFKDFIAFNTVIEETEDLPPSELIGARLDFTLPVQYEDFLAAVSMSLHFLPHSGRISHSLLRASFFIEHVLEPLSEDLKTKEYRGYHFTGDNLPKFYREYAAYCHQRYLDQNFAFDTYVGRSSYKIPEPIRLSETYATAYLCIKQGNVQRAYNIIKNYGDNAGFSFLQKELRQAGYTDYADEILQMESERHEH
ncbi:MAG: hypothetical protein LBG04_00360 [Holosporaceae bacterium]|jgi:hypothetical protein|nr:hypothetical protein [Holosporaceae bacterium]